MSRSSFFMNGTKTSVSSYSASTSLTVCVILAHLNDHTRICSNALLLWLNCNWICLVWEFDGVSRSTRDIWLIISEIKCIKFFILIENFDISIMSFTRLKSLASNSIVCISHSQMDLDSLLDSHIHQMKNVNLFWPFHRFESWVSFSLKSDYAAPSYVSHYWMLIWVL